jgi:hypothetical protein
MGEFTHLAKRRKKSFERQLLCFGSLSKAGGGGGARRSDQKLSIAYSRGPSKIRPEKPSARGPAACNAAVDFTRDPFDPRICFLAPPHPPVRLAKPTRTHNRPDGQE